MTPCVRILDQVGQLKMPNCVKMDCIVLIWLFVKLFGIILKITPTLKSTTSAQIYRIEFNMITVLQKNFKVSTEVTSKLLVVCYVTGKFIKTDNHLSVVLDLVKIFAKLQGVKQEYTAGHALQESVKQLTGRNFMINNKIAIRQRKQNRPPQRKHTSNNTRKNTKQRSNKKIKK